MNNQAMLRNVILHVLVGVTVGAVLGRGRAVPTRLVSAPVTSILLNEVSGSSGTQPELTLDAEKVLLSLRSSQNLDQQGNLLSQLELLPDGLSKLLKDGKALTRIGDIELCDLLLAHGIKLEEVAINPSRRLGLLSVMLESMEPKEAFRLLLSSKELLQSPAAIKSVAFALPTREGELTNFILALPRAQQTEAFVNALPAFLATGQSKTVETVLVQSAEADSFASKLLQSYMNESSWYGIPSTQLSEFVEQIRNPSLQAEGRKLLTELTRQPK